MVKESVTQSTSLKGVRNEPSMQRVTKGIALEIGFRLSGNGEVAAGVPPTVMVIKRPSESEFSRELDAVTALFEGNAAIVYWSIYVIDWYKMRGRNNIKPTISCFHKKDRILFGSDLSSLNSVAKLARAGKFSKKFELQA